MSAEPIHSATSAGKSTLGFHVLPSWPYSAALQVGALDLDVAGGHLSGAIFPCRVLEAMVCPSLLVFQKQHLFAASGGYLGQGT